MRRRISGLDGLRALSIVFVIMAHATGSPGFPGWLTMPRVWNSAIGLTMFFALSGYLITGLLLDEEERHGRIDLRAFYLRRAIRILPAAFTYLACLALLSALWPRPLVTLSDLAPALLFSRNIFTGGSVFTKHYWSLSVEEQFYLLWPAALMLTPRKWILPAALAWCAFDPIWLHFNVVHAKGAFNAWRLDIRLSSMLIGVVFAIAERNARLRGPIGWLSARSPLLFLFGVGCIVVCQVFDGSEHLAGFALNALFKLGIGAILFGAVRGPGSIAAAFLNSVPLEVVGRLSYSIYLWQQLFTVDEGWGEKVPWFAHFPLCLVSIGVFASASYWLIEQPLLRVRARILPLASTHEASARPTLGVPLALSGEPDAGRVSGSHP